jgi:ABC-2 type transport system ATP-binding protein
MGDAQTLCDRILLIDGGRRVLYGTVPDVRGAFSDGAVEVVGRDVPLDPAGYHSVSHVTAVDGKVRFLLRPEASAQELFRELAATGAVIERFTLDAPDLSEVFLRAVAGDARAELVA